MSDEAIPPEEKQLIAEIICKLEGRLTCRICLELICPNAALSEGRGGTYICEDATACKNAMQRKGLAP
jgi:hypothetical protein